MLHGIGIRKAYNILSSRDLQEHSFILEIREQSKRDLFKVTKLANGTNGQNSNFSISLFSYITLIRFPLDARNSGGIMWTI
jgi:hypothetical protein